jgi:3-oxoacyl-(acyl-carrier-protein) synthase
MYNGWIDVSTGEAVAEHTVKTAYEAEMVKNAGIRIIESERFEGYDPKKKQFLHEVCLERPMAWIDVASQAEADEFRVELGADSVDVRVNDTGIWQIKLKQGAVISIPRALRFDRQVAGQVPQGWDAARYGIPDNIISQVDPITLYTLVSTAEAFITAGVPDPYEFYEYVHVSQVGNTMGGGMGGMRSLTRIFHNRKMEHSVQGDILQESFINVMPAWVNMLLLSSSGPIKTPVGACATAAESVDIGVETIRSGKAEIVLCGGYDDFGEEGSFEFAQMKATSNTETEMGMGREPKEQCRPCTTTRGGFMEAHGAGIQILMTAALAVKMGCPIYAVIGLTSTASDKEGRSVPAPGRGILTTARERATLFPSPLLDLTYRRKSLEFQLSQVEHWKQHEVRNVKLMEQALAKQKGEKVGDSFRAEREKLINIEFERQRSQAILHWGNDFYIGRDEIAPLRGALAVWGLTVDDLAVTSFHGTGTNANDKNESAVTQLQMEFLGRTKGNPLLVICQKYLTGHPKGAAAAWMLNGLMQAMKEKRVPGNRNADNIAKELAKFDHLLYPNESIDMSRTPFYAGMLKSFGFGQAGAEILVLHPDLLLGALEPEVYATYLNRRSVREAKAFRYLQQTLAGKRTLLDVKTAPPYTPEQEEAVYLDPAARAVHNAETRKWSFTVTGAPPKHEVVHAESTITKHDSHEAEVMLASMRTDAGFGVMSSSTVALEQRVAELEQQVEAASAAEARREALAPTTPRPSTPSWELPPRGGGSKSPHTGRSADTTVDTKVKLEVTMREAAENIRQYGDKGIGIDVEPTSTFKAYGAFGFSSSFLRSTSAIGIHACCWLKAQHAYDPITPLSSLPSLTVFCTTHTEGPRSRSLIGTSPNKSKPTAMRLPIQLAVLQVGGQRRRRPSKPFRPPRKTLDRCGTVRVFRQKFTLEDAIGSHACSLEANMRVTNGIPLGCLLFLPVHTANCVQTLKAWRRCASD